MKRKSSTLKM